GPSVVGLSQARLRRHREGRERLVHVRKKSGNGREMLRGCPLLDFSSRRHGSRLVVEIGSTRDCSDETEHSQRQIWLDRGRGRGGGRTRPWFPNSHQFMVVSSMEKCCRGSGDAGSGLAKVGVAGS
ncbi:hypothetical protein AKJ16_DCAP26895, partial [Drosera capensis]